MNRCHSEFSARSLESKGLERSRADQLAQRRVSLALFLMEQGAHLESVRTPEELTEVVAHHSHRLSAEDFHCFAELMQAKFGPAFVRQAGLPSRSPRLRVA